MFNAGLTNQDYVTRAPSQCIDHISRYGISIIKIRRSCDRVIFNYNEIPYTGKTFLYWNNPKIITRTSPQHHDVLNRRQLDCFTIFQDNNKEITYASHHCPESKVPGANMGPIWGRQDPDGPHVGPMNFVIWVAFWKRNQPMNRGFHAQRTNNVIRVSMPSSW